eukprot:Nitzschia sp. Nitz4//scaffold173_size47512//20376//21767//NITZ4_007158-RA/size47512-augustus-gene-0.6-mRNA-1//-1//CDS//3329538802//6782//frame0
MTNETSLTYLRPEVAKLKQRLDIFLEREVIPTEKEFDDHLASRHGAARWEENAIPECIERLKRRALKLGLWNLFIPPRLVSHVPVEAKHLIPKLALTYREYGILAETMGRCEFGAMVCNCSAPDTGNMEVLLEFGTPEQKKDYLIPLLEGKIRSAFLMTEPDVASSDPTNLGTKLMKNGPNSYTLTGRKWWSSGAMHPHCRIAIVVAKMDYATGTKPTSHNKHTICMVPLPHAQVKMVRPLTVYGYDDAPFGHAEVSLNSVQLTSAHLIGGEGSGFKVSQARLGPGRIHHCMRSVGLAQRCYELMLKRSTERRAFGKFLFEHGSVQRDIADSFQDITAARLLTLNCAHEMDLHGPQASRHFISSIKVAVPNLAYAVIDRALQVHGGGGVCDDFVLAKASAGMRSLRLADGPDEVHRRAVARIEMKRYFKENGIKPPRSKL